VTLDDGVNSVVSSGVVDFFVSDSIVNNPPYLPSNPNPDDGIINVGINAFLSWTGGDPDAGDSVVYDVYFGTDSTPDNGELVSSGQSSSFYDPGYNLNYLTTYYWQIVAWDNHNEETEGIVWSFTTMDDSGTNNPPHKPSNPNPSNGASNQGINVDLSWTGGDPDSGDLATYDIYFGTSTNPPLIISGHTSTNYDYGQLEEETTYYWKIIPRDSFGDTNPGDVWSFSTAAGQSGISFTLTKLNTKQIGIEVTNHESIVVSNVQWNVEMKGGLLGRVNLTSSGSIAGIDPEVTETALSDEFDFGLGIVEIKTTVIANGVTYTDESIGLIIGYFVIII